MNEPTQEPQTVQMLSVLAEPTRLAALWLLRDGREHCVCELMEALDKGQSTMSRHMTALKKAGLVVDRRDAQWVRYRRNPDLSKPVAALLEAVLALETSLKRKTHDLSLSGQGCCNRTARR